MTLSEGTIVRCIGIDFIKPAYGEYGVVTRDFKNTYCIVQFGDISIPMKRGEIEIVYDAV